MSDMQNTGATSTRGADTTTKQDSLEERLERIEKQLDQLLEVRGQLESNGAILLDTFDSHMQRMADEGIDVEERAHELSLTVERLSAPETQQALRQLLELLPTISEQAVQLPGLIAIAVDTFDASVQRLKQRGVDISEMAEPLSKLVESLADGQSLRQITELLESGILDPSSLRVLGRAASALSKTSSDPSEPRGIFSALRATSDPMVKRTIDFAVRFAREFGKRSQRQLPE
jgi:uncharacterized protein YjgD (DUF1641 family)